MHRSDGAPNPDEPRDSPETRRTQTHGMPWGVRWGMRVRSRGLGAQWMFCRMGRLSSLAWMGSSNRAGIQFMEGWASEAGGTWDRLKRIGLALGGGQGACVLLPCLRGYLGRVQPTGSATPSCLLICFEERFSSVLKSYIHEIKKTIPYFRTKFRKQETSSYSSMNTRDAPPLYPLQHLSRAKVNSSSPSQPTHEPIFVVLSPIRKLSQQN